MERRLYSEFWLEAANKRIAELEAGSAAVGSPPPMRDVRWGECTAPLYEVMMGTENMGPLLYNIIRFVKVSAFCCVSSINRNHRLVQ